MTTDVLRAIVEVATLDVPDIEKTTDSREYMHFGKKISLLYCPFDPRKAVRQLPLCCHGGFLTCNCFLDELRSLHVELMIWYSKHPSCAIALSHIPCNVVFCTVSHISVCINLLKNILFSSAGFPFMPLK